MFEHPDLQKPATAPEDWLGTKIQYYNNRIFDKLFVEQYVKKITDNAREHGVIGVGGGKELIPNIANIYYGKKGCWNVPRMTVGLLNDLVTISQKEVTWRMAKDIHSYLTELTSDRGHIDINDKIEAGYVHAWIVLSQSFSAIAEDYKNSIDKKMFIGNLMRNLMKIVKDQPVDYEIPLAIASYYEIKEKQYEDVIKILGIEESSFNTINKANTSFANNKYSVTSLSWDDVLDQTYMLESDSKRLQAAITKAWTSQSKNNQIVYANKISSASGDVIAINFLNNNLEFVTTLWAEDINMDQDTKYQLMLEYRDVLKQATKTHQWLKDLKNLSMG